MVSVNDARSAHLNGIEREAALNVFHVTLDNLVIHNGNPQILRSLHLDHSLPPGRKSANLPGGV